MLKNYIKDCYRLSHESAWKSADSIIGYAFGLILSLLLIVIFSGSEWGTELAKFVPSPWFQIVAVIVLAYPFNFLFRMIFAAPFQLYVMQKQEVNKLDSELEAKKREVNDLANADIPNISFEEAIPLVEQYCANLLDADFNIADEIVKMIFYRKLKAWGHSMPTIKLFGPDSTNLREIPYQFFYSPNFIPNELGVYHFELLEILPDWSDYGSHTMYDNVHLNKKQLKAVFSNFGETEIGEY